MNNKKILVRGARVHNLKNVNIDIPREKLVVATGPSGSGKSSLLFDTIYAECQRRYLENISDYPKQFLNLLNKPEVDQLEGLSPAISIGEKGLFRSPRSTVGTMNEIYDYLRILFAVEGKAHCFECGQVLQKNSAGSVVDWIISLTPDSRIFIMAPININLLDADKVIGMLKKYSKMGYQKIQINDEIFNIKDYNYQSLASQDIQNIDLVIDRIQLSVKNVGYKDVLGSVEHALEVSGGFVKISYYSVEQNINEEKIFSDHLFCFNCGVACQNIEPKMFSFNNPYGACASCTGLGIKLEIDADLIIPNKNLTLDEGALRPWANLLNKWDEYISTLNFLKKHYGIAIDIPVSQMKKEELDFVLFGETHLIPKLHCTKNTKQEVFLGAVKILEQKYYDSNSEYVRNELEKYMVKKNCPTCLGHRLSADALAVKIANKSISEFTSLNIVQEIKFLQNIIPQVSEKSQVVVREIIKRLGFLSDIGLGYLSLMRSSETLSSGEARRVKLATQLSSSLQGIIYVLDEPSIGLHRRDDHNLLVAMKKLRDQGNSVLVVEHDAYFMLNADWIIDMGPQSGEAGGQIIATGTPEEIMKSECITGRYLSGRNKVMSHKKKRSGSGKYITIENAEENNLKNVSVQIPLGKFVCVTGVSGSGKSTLINNVLARTLLKQIHNSQAEPGKCKRIKGVKNISKVICIDQSSIGRTPRSNPATYTGIFTHIRELFANLSEAKKHKFKSGHFSFNVKGGRCEHCKGDGVVKLEMFFLPDAYVVCEQCKGKRYNTETLSIEYNGVNIADVLDMSVERALDFFRDVTVLQHKLSILNDVGLGYMRLGQSAITLSGGEAQRIKLATELARPIRQGRTLYILDEPTVGLHFDDIKKLLNVLNKLADRGETVLVIEHNMDIIKCADWVIDLGPDGGDNGGEIIFEGTPSELAKCKRSLTGKYLSEIL